MARNQSVLFVCLGNICRSPVAEAVLQAKVQEKGLDQSFSIDSAGTSSTHAGEKADPRMIRAARNLGYEVSSISRQFVQADFSKFDWIFCMDENNLRSVRNMANSALEKDKAQLLSSLSKEVSLNIPDPYYGGKSGFTEVIELVEIACDAFLRRFEKN